jgi:hypothetical protein
MIKIDRLRNLQEQRLVPALEAWNEAKRHLEGAIALAEARERDYRALSEDVQRRLDALELVANMAVEAGDEVPPSRQLNAAALDQTILAPLANLPEKVKADPIAETSVPVRKQAADLPAFNGMMRRTSRPLFPSGLRSRDSRLSILQEP